jgi:hypothetical protein
MHLAMRRSIPLLLVLLACAAALPAAASAQLPADVTRVERAVLDLHDAKEAAAREKTASQRAARRALARCKTDGPGWDRIRAVKQPSQRNLFIRGGHELWAELDEAAQNAAALKAYTKAFERFTGRFDQPLSDPVLQAGVEAIASRLKYEAAASEFGTCETFEGLTKAVREFEHGVPADFKAGAIYQRMSKFAQKKRNAAIRKFWPSARLRAADAARARLTELGGDQGRATYFRYAYSLKG